MRATRSSRRGLDRPHNDLTNSKPSSLEESIVTGGLRGSACGGFAGTNIGLSSSTEYLRKQARPVRQSVELVRSLAVPERPERVTTEGARDGHSAVTGRR
jgi:hypothetical protein